MSAVFEVSLAILFWCMMIAVFCAVPRRKR